MFQMARGEAYHGGAKTNPQLRTIEASHFRDNNVFGFYP